MLHLIVLSCCLPALTQAYFWSAGLQSEDDWPPMGDIPCNKTTKQKAMYAGMTYKPSLKKKPFTRMRVGVKLDDFRWNPHLPENKNGGGVYIAYTIPGGYLGVQFNNRGGNFKFSIWDGGRWVDEEGKKTKKSNESLPQASDRLVWPMASTCRRNCQDCGRKVRKYSRQGYTTGTQCSVKRNIEIGDEFEIVLEQTEIDKTINTKDFGGMPEGHVKLLNETDRDVTGAVWTVSATHKQVAKGTEELVHVGTLLFENTKGDGVRDGFKRLGTFDEMLGCNGCNKIQHKDTRYGPFVSDRDGIERGPVKMTGSNKGEISDCKYRITGSASDSSLSFEGGPLTEDTPQRKGTIIWEEQSDDNDMQELVDLGLAAEEDLLFF